MKIVLVVDDSGFTHVLLRSAFARAGYGTLHAEDAGAALHLLTNEHVDAMITDIVMPDMDGMELVRSARANPDVDNSLPIVFYSAHVDLSDARRRAAELQPATVVSKDGNVQELVTAVSSLIEAHAAVKEIPAAVILHVGSGLVAVSVQRDGHTVFELRRGEQVLLEAPTVEELTDHARLAGLD